jgi:hypothetical protein
VSKLTVPEVREIYVRSQRETAVSLAREFDISVYHVRNIKHRRCWWEALKDLSDTPYAALNGKLTPPQVREVYTRMLDGEQLKDLAPEFGVTRSCLTEIKHRRTWREVTQRVDRERDGTSG